MKYSVNFDIELKKNPYPGFYIALEGIDGSGKTTQVEEIAKYFESLGREVLKTHEPRRETVVGKLVHEVLQESVEVPAVSLQYLFAADRAIHQVQIVIPALEAGKVVISDRTFWSSIPYGLLDKYLSERDENMDQLLTALSILSMYHEFITPDIGIVLDVSVDTAGQRLSELSRKAEIYEKKDKLLKIKEGYDLLLEKFPEELVKIDGEKEISSITQEILHIVEKIAK